MRYRPLSELRSSNRRLVRLPLTLLFSAPMRCRFATCELDARLYQLRRAGAPVAIDMGSGGFLTDVPCEAIITKGRSDVGTIQITVIGQFDGVPGDMMTGNGNYDQAPVTVRGGLIRIQ